MNKLGFLSLFSVIVLAGTLALGGCNKKSAQQAGNQPPGAPSGQPNSPQPQAAGQPAPANAVPAQQQQAAPPPPAPPAPPATVEIPVGTRLRVRLDQDLGSKISQPGETFSATVADPVVVAGTTVIPRGARAEGTVIDAKPLGRFKGGALLEVRLERVRTNWGSYPVATSTIERAEAGKGKRSAGFIGGGGGLGALIGGLAGGGKGALIGALAGAGAGTAGTAFTGNKQIVLPAETLLTFRLEHAVHVTQ
jgi:hypothetical protein